MMMLERDAWNKMSLTLESCLMESYEILNHHLDVSRSSKTCINQT